MGKHGNPGQLNSWASSLSSASSSLSAVVADLKAASPYTLGDASFHNVRVTAGTTHVTVGHYSGYMGNQGAPITKVETKWVTEKALNQAGVAQNSGSFMTWLPGTVPSFGNTANTWQGYAASMFANLLQDFVNTIEEIQNTIDQLTKSLKAIADSITQSRKWWHILLEVILPIIAIFVVAVVNFFFPGLGAALLGVISNGLRFLGSIVGVVGEGAIDVSALDAVEVASTLTEETPALTETATLSDIGSVLDIPETLTLNPLQILSKIPGFLPGIGNTDIIAFPITIETESSSAFAAAEALSPVSFADTAATDVIELSVFGAETVPIDAGAGAEGAAAAAVVDNGWLTDDVAQLVGDARWMFIPPRPPVIFFFGTSAETSTVASEVVSVVGEVIGEEPPALVEQVAQGLLTIPVSGPPTATGSFISSVPALDSIISSESEFFDLGIQGIAGFDNANVTILEQVAEAELYLPTVTEIEVANQEIVTGLQAEMAAIEDAIAHEEPLTLLNAVESALPERLQQLAVLEQEVADEAALIENLRWEEMLPGAPAGTPLPPATPFPPGTPPG